MSTEKSSSGEQSNETVRQGTEGTVGELSTQNQTGGTAGQTGSGTGTAGQILPTATAGSSMTATSSKNSFEYILRFLNIFILRYWWCC
jgi:hypothetical protein